MAKKRNPQQNNRISVNGQSIRSRRRRGRKNGKQNEGTDNQVSRLIAKKRNGGNNKARRKARRRNDKERQGGSSGVVLEPSSASGLTYSTRFDPSTVAPLLPQMSLKLPAYQIVQPGSSLQPPPNRNTRQAYRNLVNHSQWKRNPASSKKQKRAASGRAETIKRKWITPKSITGGTHMFSIEQTYCELLNKQSLVGYTQFKQLSLTQQLDEMMEANTLSSEEYKRRQRVVSEISMILESHFWCKIYPFGSYITGIGDTRSDIDIYVDLYGDEGKRIQQMGKKETGQVQDQVIRILQGATSPSPGTSTPTAHPFAQNVASRPKKCLLIRMEHASTGISCDLSFSESLAVNYTELLQFYMGFDKRVKPFFIWLRIWTKMIGIDGWEIKKYALTLMAIVYLTKKRIIPSVNLLQKLGAPERHSPSEHYGRKNWSGSFCREMDLIGKYFQPLLDDKPKVTRGEDLVSMAMEFLEMFGNLDYHSHVICPLTGDLIPRDNFSQVAKEGLPEPIKHLTLENIESLKLQRPLCIQDPFELDCNVGAKATNGIVTKFKEECGNLFQFLKGKNGKVESLLDLYISRRRRGESATGVKEVEEGDEQKWEYWEDDVEWTRMRQ